MEDYHSDIASHEATEALGWKSPEHGSLRVDDLQLMLSKLRAYPRTLREGASGREIQNNQPVLGCAVRLSHKILFCFAFCSFIAVGQAYGQFTSIINVPPDLATAEIGSDTQLNLFDTGVISQYFSAGTIDGTSSNVEVNIFGGEVVSGLFANSGSTLNISGGSLGSIGAYNGSVVNISGGSLGAFFRANSGSQVNIFGGEFRLDGMTISGLDTVGDSLALNLPDGAVLSGVVADGTPFAFSSLDSNRIDDGTLTLIASELPPTGPAVIVVPSDPAPLGIRAGQTLIIEDGGEIGRNFNAGWGSRVNLSGGMIDRRFSALGAQVTISDGWIDSFFEAAGGSVVDISGGLVSNGFHAHDSLVNISGGRVWIDFVASGSVVNISGGEVGSRFVATGGSVVNISGGLVKDAFNVTDSELNISSGSVGTGFRANSGSVVNISSGSIGNGSRANEGSIMNIDGGTIGDYFNANSGSEVNLVGGEFRLNGMPVGGLKTPGDRRTFNLPEDSVLSGTLADGTPFAFSSFGRDEFADGTLTLSSVELPPIGPVVIVAPRDLVPQGIRTGQTLIVEDREVGEAQLQSGSNSLRNTLRNPDVRDQFQAGRGSTVVVTGGSVGNNLEAVGAQVIVTGGSVGSGFDAFDGSQITISGGRVGGGFGLYGGSEVTISGGTVDRGFNTNGGSKVNISGGLVGTLSASDSVVNISGGMIDVVSANDSIVNLSDYGYVTRINANSGSTVNISGGSTGTAYSSGSIANNGSILNISGGSIGDYLHAKDGSQVTLFGNDFRLDGELISGLSSVGTSLAINVPDGSVLSGLLTDGTPFAFSTSDSDRFAVDTLTLAATELPSMGLEVITLPSDPAPSGVRSGQTIVIADGGAVGNNFNAAWGSSVIITGGQVGDNFETVGAEVTITGGSVGRGFDAFLGSVVNISGGNIISRFDANSGSVVNISGDAVVGGLNALTGSVVNISGGTVSGSVHANGAEVNISGGTTGFFFQAQDSVVSISGGSVGDSFRAEKGTQVSISGGSVGDRFTSFSGSQVDISGGEFRVDGSPLTGLNILESVLPYNLPKGSVLTGTLTDGTPFAFFNGDTDRFVDGTLTLTATALPPIGPSTIVVPSEPAPLGIRTGQTLVLVDGGTVGDNFNAGMGSKVVVTGGQVGRNFEAVGAQVIISGGTIGDEFDAFLDSEVSISGGTFGDGFTAFRGGSVVNITGGEFGWRFQAGAGSVVNISGGTFDRLFRTSLGSLVNISGGEFRLDGVPVSGFESLVDGQAVNLNKGSVLSGVLANGTPFAFSSLRFDNIADGTLRLTTAALPPVGPAVILLPNDTAPLGIRSGQTLVIQDGGVVHDNFLAGWDSTLVIAGGKIGRGFVAVGAKVSISGGTVGELFGAFSGSEVNISGGSVGENFRANSGSVVNISDGTVGENFNANQGSVINISGGVIGNYFHANSGSIVNLFGTQFTLGGVDITDMLDVNIPFNIKKRDVTLKGVLADGSLFRFNLNSKYPNLRDLFSPTAKLSVTLVAAVPEPASVLLILPVAAGIGLRRRRVVSSMEKNRNTWAEFGVGS